MKPEYSSLTNRKVLLGAITTNPFSVVWYLWCGISGILIRNERRVPINSAQNNNKKFILLFILEQSRS